MKIQLLYGAFLNILKAVPNTLLMALIIMISGILLGTVFAFVKLKRIPLLSQILGVLIGYIRGTPMIVQIFIVYYSLPYFLSWMINSIFGTELRYFDIPNLVTIYFSYILCTAGYQCEVIRGALASVESGQMEAGYSVGMTERQTLFRIVFPQALSVAIPSLIAIFSLHTSSC